MKKKRLVRLKRSFRHMAPRHIIKSHVTSSTIERFADHVGLVFFGHVDQRDDEHRLVRGHTVSATHIDRNYCVGSLRGYDVSIVSRNDVILTKDLKREERCHWLIVTIDLKTIVDIPHFYIGHESSRLAFTSSFEQLLPLAPSLLQGYPKSFTDHYLIYAKPTYAAYIGSLVVSQIAETISSHFKQASIEIEDNCIYLYIESEHPSEVLLEKMVSNGLWLAEALDARSQQLIQASGEESN